MAPLPIALDHNFSEPLLDCLGPALVEAQLDPIRRIHARLPELTDVELVLTLPKLSYWMLVTNNYKMLKNPQEVAAILASRMTIVAIEGLGHDPIRAVGALLLDLPGIVRQFDQSRPKIYWMRPRNPHPELPWSLIERIAGHLDVEATELYDQYRVSAEERDTDYLA